MKSSVEFATATWGERSLSALEAEDRLSIACEKAPTEDPVTSKLRDAFMKMVEEFKVQTDLEKQEVIALGGLHVVGTERHESRRIDNQLRGRCARQVHILCIDCVVCLARSRFQVLTDEMWFSHWYCPLPFIRVILEAQGSFSAWKISSFEYLVGRR